MAARDDRDWRYKHWNRETSGACTQCKHVPRLKLTRKFLRERQLEAITGYRLQGPGFPCPVPTSEAD